MALTPKDVGQRIRAAREERGWTNEELARRMGANWRTVQRWQAGSLPRLPTLLRLADVLEVPHSQLVGPEDPAVTVGDVAGRVDDLARRVDELARTVSALELKLGKSANDAPAEVRALPRRT